MSTRKEKPLPLLLLTSLYFLIGFMALLAVFSEQTDYYALVFLPIAYGLLKNKLWAHIGAMVYVALQAVVLAVMLFGSLFSSTGYAEVSIVGFKLTVEPWVGVLCLGSFISAQLYALLSKNTKAYLSQT